MKVLLRPASHCRQTRQQDAHEIATHQPFRPPTRNQTVSEPAEHRFVATPTRKRLTQTGMNPLLIDWGHLICPLLSSRPLSLHHDLSSGTTFRPAPSSASRLRPPSDRYKDKDDPKVWSLHSGRSMQMKYRVTTHNVSASHSGP
ncbi:unnamed protein product [Protopolystoma xenopodis]|uniref:Uncharacterized protein n=1 Tax=Protopolystoma xenopodis TaxID=117903 RepID=A0A3S5B9U3_9PLAT|nr:unnamed protein product [Protopolystoma xenopodis]